VATTLASIASFPITAPPEAFHTLADLLNSWMITGMPAPPVTLSAPDTVTQTLMTPIQTAWDPAASQAALLRQKKLPAPHHCRSCGRSATDTPLARVATSTQSRTALPLITPLDTRTGGFRADSRDGNDALCQACAVGEKWFHNSRVPSVAIAYQPISNQVTATVLLPHEYFQHSLAPTLRWLTHPDHRFATIFIPASDYNQKPLAATPLDPNPDTVLCLTSQGKKTLHRYRIRKHILTQWLDWIETGDYATALDQAIATIWAAITAIDSTPSAWSHLAFPTDSPQTKAIQPLYQASKTFNGALRKTWQDQLTSKMEHDWKASPEEYAGLKVLQSHWRATQVDPIAPYSRAIMAEKNCPSSVAQTAKTLAAISEGYPVISQQQTFQWQAIRYRAAIWAQRGLADPQALHLSSL